MVFADPAIAIRPGLTDIYIEDNVTRCPKCGNDAWPLNAVYDTVDDKIAIRLYPSEPPEIREAIAGLIAAVQAGRISLGTASREADKVKPGLGKLFDVSEWNDMARATFFSRKLLVL